MFSGWVRRAFSVPVLLLVSVVANEHIIWAQDGPISVGEAGKSITNFVNDASRCVGFSGVVLAAREGEIVAVVAVGSTNGKSLAAMETTTLFEIASATKPFTAIAVLLLQQQGKLKLDDSIAEYLPDVPPDCHAITIRHLLQHTSGIPGTNSKGAGNDLSVVLPMFLKGGPKHPPGTHWEYWNQGYSILSEIIARASGKTFVQYCKEGIFEPCNMKVSCFTGDDPPKGVSVATGDSSSGRPRSALEHPYGSYGYQYRGMGGLVTNVWDVWRWDRTLESQGLLTAHSIREMTTPGLGGYALGWQIGTTPDGRPFHGHGGSVRGFFAEVRRYPSDNGCLVVLSNSDSRTPFMMVVTGCEQLLFGEDLSIAFPQPLQTKFLASIVGGYKAEGQRRLVIEREGAIARARILWGGGLTSYAHIGADESGGIRWFEATSNRPIEFEMDEDGTAKSCSFMKMTFEREQLGAALLPLPGLTAQLFIGRYKPDSNGMIPITSQAKVVVLPQYVGVRNGVRLVDRRVTFVVKDLPKRMWPVIVKMNDSSAQQLAKDLEIGVERMEKAGPESMKVVIRVSDYEANDVGKIDLPATLRWRVACVAKGEDVCLSLVLEDTEGGHEPVTIEMGRSDAEKLLNTLKLILRTGNIPDTPY